jgi:hypothetical protein
MNQKRIIEKGRILLLALAMAGLALAAGCSAHAGYDMGTPDYVIVGD